MYQQLDPHQINISDGLAEQEYLYSRVIGEQLKHYQSYEYSTSHITIYHSLLLQLSAKDNFNVLYQLLFIAITYRSIIEQNQNNQNECLLLMLNSIPQQHQKDNQNNQVKYSYNNNAITYQINYPPTAKDQQQSSQKNIFAGCKL